MPVQQRRNGDRTTHEGRTPGKCPYRLDHVDVLVQEACELAESSLRPCQHSFLSLKVGQSIRANVERNKRHRPNSARPRVLYRPKTRTIDELDYLKETLEKI